MTCRQTNLPDTGGTMADRVLITGGTGFLGSAVARAFAESGYRLRLMLRENSPRENVESLEAEFITANLANASSLRAAVDGCDGVVHVAADYRLFVPEPTSMYRVNVEGTRDLMKAAKEAHVRRIVYTSSVAVLGHRDDGTPADENTPSTETDMIGHYKRSKFLAEAAVRHLVAGDGLPAVIVNPSAPVGPRDIKPTPTGRMVLDAARGRMPAYLDTGLNIVHVDDVAAGHLAAYERGRPGERYILGGDNLELREILAGISHLMGRRPPRIRLAPGPLVPFAWCAEIWARASGTRPFLTRDELAMARHPMYYTSAKAERELGYAHRPAMAAFADALAWFGAHRRLAIPAGGLHYSPDRVPREPA